MNRLDKQNLINILKPFKDKIDNLSSGYITDLNSFKSEVATQLNNKLSLTGGALMGPLSIINDKTNIVLSAQEKSARLTIGSNHLDLTDEGKLKVNDKSVLMDGDVVSGSGSGNIEVKLPDDLIKITTTSTGPSTTVTTSKNIYTKYATMPYKYISGAGACKIGNEIFLFGGENRRDAYKFNVSSKTFTKLPNIPVVMDGGSSSVVVNGMIYLIGCGTSYLDNYKYDKTTNTYTKIAKIPTTAAMNTVSRTINGECIYICGLGNGNQGAFTQIYKYSIGQGTFSKLTDKMPYYFNESANMCAHNTTLELFGLGNDNKYHYAFDLSTYTFTKKNDMPYKFRNGTLTSYAGVYLFNSYSGNNFYKYDYDTDTYSKMTDIPYDFTGGSVSNITSASEPIYLFGGNSSYSNKVYTVTRNPISSTTTIPGTTTTSTYTAMLKPSGHSIYTASHSYTSSSAQLVAINASDYYTEYDENNNVIKNTSAISSTGTTKLYVKSGGKLHGKDLPSSTGWQTINLLKYI